MQRFKISSNQIYANRCALRSKRRRKKWEQSSVLFEPLVPIGKTDTHLQMIRVWRVKRSGVQKSSFFNRLAGTVPFREHWSLTNSKMRFLNPQKDPKGGFRPNVPRRTVGPSSTQVFFIFKMFPEFRHFSKIYLPVILYPSDGREFARGQGGARRFE